MKNEFMFSEVHSDFIDEDGTIYIDAYKTSDDNENGLVVATIKDGVVNWRDDKYQYDTLVKEAISDVLNNN